MPHCIRAPREFLAGVLFGTVGLTALLVGADYRTGTLLSMGPGYFPRVVAALLVALGAAMAAGSLRWHGMTLDAWHWRPLLFVLGAIVAFAWTLESFGLFIAIAWLIALSAFAQRDRRFLEVPLLILGLAFIAWLIFIQGLGLPLLIWPALFTS